ncbi:MAG: DUF6318 family protein [Kineosporiaceae bacterium]
MLVGLVLVAMGVSGCSDGGERPSGSVTVASPTETYSGGTAGVLLPPTLPPAASEHTVAGAEAAFRHFLDLYAYAFAAADPDPLRNVCSAESEFCKSTISAVEGLRGRDRRFKGAGFTNRLVVGTPTGDPDQVVIRAAFDQTQAVLVSYPDGATLKTEKAVKGAGMDSRLSWDGFRWVIVKLTVDPEKTK